MEPTYYDTFTRIKYQLVISDHIETQKQRFVAIDNVSIEIKYRNTWWR